MKITVLVKPGARQGDRIVASADGLTVFLRAKAVDGAANQALIALLAKHFRVPKTQIAIVAGKRSRRKIVEIPEREE